MPAVGLEPIILSARGLKLQVFFLFVLHFVLHSVRKDGAFEEGVDFFVLLGFLFLYDMLIYVFEHIRGGVTHALHGVYIGHAQVDHDGGVIVAQVVETEGHA